MKTMKTETMNNIRSTGNRTSFLFRLLAVLLALCLLPVFALGENAESAETTDESVTLSDGVVIHPYDWTNFLLICNEGMNNNGGNAGNTLSVVAINPKLGKIHLMMFTWDTFIDYEGYEVPQRIDMPYRNNGPEEVMKVFDDNFGLDINLFMSLNYLNLASLIDSFGGVTVDISRAERNALNGMVASKKRDLQSQIGMGILSQAIDEPMDYLAALSDAETNAWKTACEAVGIDFSELEFSNWVAGQPYTAADYAALQ